ncbi:MAG: sugar-transfer associated ATP-grasp domain-containing protein [Tissierellia bacterium]|nr:sugar-transfer associated ATP-grasp domain-containing protein [Tissierellia bacterium]
MSRLDKFNSLYKLSKLDNKTSKKLAIMVDVFWENIRYKTEIQDYFQYEFYKLKSCERRKYMTSHRLRQTINICNDRSKRAIFDDKALFNKTFSEYIKRDWLDLTEASYDEFKSFLDKHQSFFSKSKIGMFGKNAGRFDLTSKEDDKDIKNLYEDLREKECIIEELIDQNEELKTFNDTSVNTLRIVTLLTKEEKVKIMAAVLRIGRKGKTADNFHHFGIAATIDVEEGIVNTPGIDREFNRYISHPDSKKQIIGYKIAYWDKIVDLVKKAAMVVKEVRYIGWDVAIDKEGNIQLIEGNFGADPDVTQMPNRTGAWPLFEKELDKIKR